jgi:trimeric autotransporter adhesin
MRRHLPKHRLHSAIRIATLQMAVLAAPAALAGTYVYEGRLDDLGAPAQGRYDFSLTAYRDESGGALLGAPVTVTDVLVQDGRFRAEVELPFAASDHAWFEVAVRADGDATFSAVPGRNKAVATPLVGACWATTGDIGVNPAVNFLGTLDANPMNLRVTNVPVLQLLPAGAAHVNVIAGGPGVNPNNVPRVSAGVAGAVIAGGGAPSGGFSGAGGGDFHAVSDNDGVVGGGFGNKVGNFDANPQNAAFATIAGGLYNVASAEGAAVGGGRANGAAGFASTVPGGDLSRAGGDYSFAAGRRAIVRDAAQSGDADGDNGSFVWADSRDLPFVSTGPNQFLVRAERGMAINTNIPSPNAALTVDGRTSLLGNVAVADNGTLSFGATTRQMINLFNAEFGIGVQSSTTYLRSNDAFAFFRGGVHNNGFLEPGTGGSRLMLVTPSPAPAGAVTTGVVRAAVFEGISDRAMKTGFADIDPIDILDRVIAMPIDAWSYRQFPGIRHIGPVAQDFRAAFGLGSNDTTISTVDAAGVSLAAIQGLNAKLEAANAALRAEIDALRALIESGRRQP